MKAWAPTAVFLLAAAAAAQEPAAKKWKDSAELSFLSASGNSNAQTASAKNSASYAFDALTKAEVAAGALGARNEGKAHAEQYHAQEKVSRKLDDRDYLFQRYRWDRNRFAGVAHRHSVSMGAGREFFKTPADLLIGELSPGYLYEERIKEKRKKFVSLRAYSRYIRDITATAKFSQEASCTQSLMDKRDVRLNTETTLTATITSALSVKNSFVWHHDSRPPSGKRKDDTLLSVALIASF